MSEEVINEVDTWVREVVADADQKFPKAQVFVIVVVDRGDGMENMMFGGNMVRKAFEHYAEQVLEGGDSNTVYEIKRMQ